MVQSRPSLSPVECGDFDARSIKLLRLENVERSAARNAGANIASGELLIFIDDDISVEADFVEAHLKAHAEWPDALLVGAIRLPKDAAQTTFGRFRQDLEDTGIPMTRGITAMRNFCAAANMAISKKRFEELGGFDVTLASSEDQDLALRHTSRGGRIAFVPEARVVHRDSALDLRSYCKRAEWGAANLKPFVRRYPDFADNVVREQVNGRMRFGSEPLSQSARKLIKSFAALPPLTSALHGVASLVERVAPGSAILDRTYRALLGVHIFRGYRNGSKA